MSGRGKGAGTGYPLSFKCAKLARIWPRHEGHWAAHEVTLTGKTKPMKKGKGNPRKSWLSYQYECRCGHIGWSSHKDLERRALREGIIQEVPK